MSTIPVSAVSRPRGGLLPALFAARAFERHDGRRRLMHRHVATAVLFVAVALGPSVVSAQDRQLRAATIAASAAAAADWASTYHALKYYQVREMNPLLRPIDHAPGAMVSVGALVDAGAVTAWNKTVGKRHPKLAVAGLWAMTGFRAYLAIHNIRNEQIAARR